MWMAAARVVAGQRIVRLSLDETSASTATADHGDTSGARQATFG
jgi:hypothetical protein